MSPAMIQASDPFVFVCCIAFLQLCAWRVLKYVNYTRASNARGCSSIPRYPQKDPILGGDVALSMAKALKENGFLLWLKTLHSNMPSKTFTINFLGTRMIYTIEPENMKAMSAINWRDFGIRPTRHANKACMPFADNGVNTTDGPLWEFSRSLLKPYFLREAYTNVDRLEKHTENLLALIPTDESTFDLQPLLQRWFLDTSTHFLFGESISSLIYPERADIAWAMVDVLRGARLRLQMSKFLWLFRSQKWLDAVAVVQEFVDRHIDRTFQEMEGSKTSKTDPASAVENERSDLMWSMAQRLKHDRADLRSQMLLFFVPNNDTTSIFISNVFWNLARRPDVWAKVREEVLDVGSAPLTFERLRAMKYLNSVMNETHRLFPNGVTMVRACLTDTTLPVGGGPDGKSPIFVQKGDVVQVNKYVMHRDKDIWGKDAEEFRPERWENLRPMWTFVPFGGGPRRCPAQIQVTVEASYCITRIMQRFKAIECRDSSPYIPIMRVGPVNANGVKVVLVPV